MEPGQIVVYNSIVPEVEKIYGIIEKNDGTEYVITEDGGHCALKEWGWKPVEKFIYTLGYRSFETMDIAVARLRATQEPWFDIRMRKNNNNVSHPYTILLICDKKKIEDINKFITGITTGTDVEIINAGAFGLQEFIQLTPITIITPTDTNKKEIEVSINALPPEEFKQMVLDTMFTCNRCGHSWIPRGNKPPKVCPSPTCKSPYWNKPRKRRIK